MTHPSLLDHLFFALLLVAPLIEWRWNWPRLLARLAAGDSAARSRHYRGILAGEWLPTLALLAFWTWKARPWPALHLAGGTPWRIALAFALVAAFIALQAAQRRAVLAAPKRIDRVRRMLASFEPLIPHTPADRRLFWAVSATAGICEETFYRGFLTAYLAAFMPLLPAVLLSALIFGFGHIYLGTKQVPTTALVGLLMSLVVYLSGSLWPAMLLHAAIDWNSGELGYGVVTHSQVTAES